MENSAVTIEKLFKDGQIQNIQETRKGYRIQTPSGVFDIQRKKSRKEKVTEFFERLFSKDKGNTVPDFHPRPAPCTVVTLSNNEITENRQDLQTYLCPKHAANSADPSPDYLTAISYRDTCKASHEGEGIYYHVLEPLEDSEGFDAKLTGDECLSELRDAENKLLQDEINSTACTLDEEKANELESSQNENVPENQHASVSTPKKFNICHNCSNCSVSASGAKDFEKLFPKRRHCPPPKRPPPVLVKSQNSSVKQSDVIVRTLQCESVIVTNDTLVKEGIATDINHKQSAEEGLSLKGNLNGNLLPSTSVKRMPTLATGETCPITLVEEYPITDFNKLPYPTSGNHYNNFPTQVPHALQHNSPHWPLSQAGLQISTVEDDPGMSNRERNFLALYDKLKNEKENERE